MTDSAGQVARHTARHCMRALHPLLRLLELCLLLGLAAVFIFAWRLSRGPLEIDWIAHRLERVVNTGDGPTRLVIGHAALAWEGFREGVDRPLDIRLTDISVADPGAPKLAEVARADLSLSIGRLLTGRVVPRALDVAGARLRLLRDADGRVRLDLGSLTAAANSSVVTAARTAQTPAESFDIRHLLDELARPATGDAGGAGTRWAQLRRLRIRNATLTTHDLALGADWQARVAEVDLRRRAAGGVDGSAAADLAMGTQAIRARLMASMDPANRNTALDLSVTPFNPMQLAAAAPGLAALGALDAPVTLSASAELSPDLALRHAGAHVLLGSGTAHLGTGTMPITAAEASLETDLHAAQVRLVQLETAPPGGPPTTARASLDVQRDGTTLSGALSLDIDRVAFADLPAVWPAGTGGPGTRPWITTNITAGLAHDVHVQLAATAPDDLSDGTVTSISGGLDGDDLTVSWLRPVPPMEHLNGHLTLVTADKMRIAVQSGRQSGGSHGDIAVRGGTIVLTGIAGHDQFADIEADLAGPLPDLLTVLNHPKIRLLSRRPIDMRDPSGDIAGRLTVGHLPLKDNVLLDDLQIHTVSQLHNVHLGGIAAGRDVDHGELHLDAGNDGLKVDGTARIASIPARLAVAMDFRNGPPTQVLQRVDVAGTTSATQLAKAGLDTAGLLGGSAELKAGLVQRRDGSGDITLHADLLRTELDAARLHWAKAAGTPATADAHVSMDHDRIASIDHVTVQGEGVDVRGQADMEGGRPNVLRFQRIMLGTGTDTAGELRLPLHPGEPYVASLSGRSLDLTGVLSSPSGPRSANARAGPPWRADARLDRVVLGDGRAIQGVDAHAETDGRIVTAASISGRTESAAFDAAITPRPGGRTLTASADDAGALLRAFDVLTQVRGGRLTVSGSYDDTHAEHGLTGTADMRDFRITGAPLVAKLLQGMTLYGLVEALQGPGLGFIRLNAPFRFADDRLTLTGARAYSASLGVTAKGNVDLGGSTADLKGTIVPAYFFNTLLGEVPLVGRLFSPERGGGVFAATYTVRGPFADPAVGVNPLAALTPGFLRGVFGLFDGASAAAPPEERQQRGDR